MGVFEVPPSVRFPTEITGTGMAHRDAIPAANERLRAVRAAP